MKRSAIILDFDGTIADSFLAVVQVAHDISHRRLSDDDISYLRRLSGKDMLRALHIPLWRAFFIVAKIRRRLSKHIDTIEIIDGMDQTIRVLAKHHDLYVLSSNSLGNLSSFLRRYKIDSCFASVSGSVTPWRKARVLKKLARTNHLVPHDTWYVGDTDLDIRAAHRAGMRSAAVTWGFNNVHALEAQKPDVLIFRPDELVTHFQKVVKA